MKKLTKKQLAERAAYEQQREQELQAFEAFRDKYTGLVFAATVRWFNKLSGEGMVRGLGDHSHISMPLYACNIKGSKSWYEHQACMFHEEGREIEVEIKVFYGGSILVSHTPGFLDEEKWNSIKDKNRAFAVNDDGSVTGLFA